MANKYRFDRDSITVNGKKFPARYEVMDYDTTRGDYYTVVIFATVDGGQEQRIEVPASDKQHGAALAAAQMDAGSLADLAADAAPDGQQASSTAADDAQVQPEPAAADAAQDGQQASSAASADPKATRGPVPEKTFINEVIAGKGWSIVFDAGCNRTRVIIAEPVKAAARPIVEAAGFYYSRQHDSWNKKLTFRAYRAANALADKLRAALA